MSDIKFLEPTSLPEVLNILDRYGEETQVVAGGAFLTLVLKLGLLTVEALVSLHHLSNLDHRLKLVPTGGCPWGPWSAIEPLSSAL